MSHTPSETTYATATDDYTGTGTETYEDDYETEGTGESEYSEYTEEDSVSVTPIVKKSHRHHHHHHREEKFYDPKRVLPHQKAVKGAAGIASAPALARDKTPSIDSLTKAGESSRSSESVASLHEKYRIIAAPSPAVSSEPEKSFVSFTIAGTRAEIVAKFVNGEDAVKRDMKGLLILPLPLSYVQSLLSRDRYRDPAVTLSSKFGYDLSNVTVTNVKLHSLANNLGLPVHLKSGAALLNTVPVVSDFNEDPRMKIMATLPSTQSITDKCLFSLNSDYVKSTSFVNYFGQTIGPKDVLPIADDVYGKRAVMAVRKSTKDKSNVFHHFAHRNITEAGKHTERIVASDVEMEGGLYDVFDAEELAKVQVKFMSVVKSVPTVKPEQALTLALAPVNAGMSWERYVNEDPSDQVSFSMTVCVHWIAPVRQEQSIVVAVAAAPSPSREDLAKAKHEQYLQRVAAAAKTEL